MIAGRKHIIMGEADRFSMISSTTQSGPQTIQSNSEIWKNYVEIWISPAEDVVRSLMIMPSSSGENPVSPDDRRPVLCLRPRPAAVTPEPPGVPATPSPAASIKTTRLKTFSLFALTASDPLGERASPEWNRRENVRLWQELQGLREEFSIGQIQNCSHDLCEQFWIWHGAAFVDTKGEDVVLNGVGRSASEQDSVVDFVEANFPSPEQGFVVAARVEDAATTHSLLRTRVLDLARKFRQGAMYEYRLRPGTGTGDRRGHDCVCDRGRGIDGVVQGATRSCKIVRSTVPVCVADCEADVELDLQWLEYLR